MAEVADRAMEALRSSEAARAELAVAVEAQDILRVLRERYRLPQQTIATACGVTDRTVRGWERGVALRQRHDDRLRVLAELIAHLSRTLTPRGVRQWLTARNPRLGGRRPTELLGADESEPIVEAVSALVGGFHV